MTSLIGLIAGAAAVLAIVLTALVIGACLLIARMTRGSGDAAGTRNAAGSRGARDNREGRGGRNAGSSRDDRGGRNARGGPAPRGARNPRAGQQRGPRRGAPAPSQNMQTQNMQTQETRRLHPGYGGRDDSGVPATSRRGNR